MLKYKINVMKELNHCGYTANYLRREKLLSESTMQTLRNKGNINTSTINIICILLNCQPSDIFEIIPSDEEKFKYLTELEKHILQALSKADKPLTFEEICNNIPIEPNYITLQGYLEELEQKDLITCDDSCFPDSQSKYSLNAPIPPT